ncbi:hypothetical protein, partial [Streptomyces sp. NPDC001274]
MPPTPEFRNYVEIILDGLDSTPGQRIVVGEERAFTAALPPQQFVYRFRLARQRQPQGFPDDLRQA